jgi:hypothetical protein
MLGMSGATGGAAMAYIKLLSDKSRSLPWRAQIRRKGHPVMVKMFASKQEAELWANEQERNIRLAGLPMTIDTLKQHTVSEIVIRYRDNLTLTKEGNVEEKSRLNKFLKHPMAQSLWHMSRNKMPTNIVTSD